MYGEGEGVKCFFLYGMPLIHYLLLQLLNNSFIATCLKSHSSSPLAATILPATINVLELWTRFLSAYIPPEEEKNVCSLDSLAERLVCKNILKTYY